MGKRPEDPLSENSIPYDRLVEAAMRDVVRQVLAQVRDHGLPGDHHFYITFATQEGGVGLSRRLRAQYPEEMTIVLQHQFDDLVVMDDRFEVKLYFNGIPERLVIPFAAIRTFVDPSVPFGLQLGAKESPDTELTAEETEAEPTPTLLPLSESKSPRTQGMAAKGEDTAAMSPSETSPSEEKDGRTDEEQPSQGATIVELDRFRRK